MSNFTKWLIGLILCMFVVTIVVVWTIQDRFFSPQPLSTAEAVAKVEELYGGTAESFEQLDDYVHVELTKNNINYIFKVDSVTGEIIITDSKQLKMAEPVQLKTKEEVRSLLASKGTIQSISLQQDNEPQYIVKITNNEVMKTVTVNAQSGEIMSVTEVAQNPPAPISIITKEKAKQIALSQLNGEVEYVVYEKASDGGYYLVEIDASNQDAVFQIHAISGKVMSITQVHDDDFDDDDDDDDDDD